jgi:hypothetical protein
MTALTNSQIKTLKVGDRVSFPHGAEAYPSFHFWGERLDGIVCEVDTDMVCVRLDVHKTDLNEWDNQIQIPLWNLTDSNLSEEEREKACHDVERLLLADDDTLSEFVRVYCAANAIDCDGDVFGLMFSGRNEWREQEAIDTIELAASAYNLRGTSDRNYDWTIG